MSCVHWEVVRQPVREPWALLPACLPAGSYTTFSVSKWILFIRRAYLGRRGDYRRDEERGVYPYYIGRGEAGSRKQEAGSRKQEGHECAE
jgi:hypothetical protein